MKYVPIPNPPAAAPEEGFGYMTFAFKHKGMVYEHSVKFAINQAEVIAPFIEMNCKGGLMQMFSLAEIDRIGGLQ